MQLQGSDWYVKLTSLIDMTGDINGMKVVSII